MSPGEAMLGVLAGFAAGVLSGLFGVGGGVVATPAISVIFGVAPVVAVATPLPVIFPTAIVGAETYRRSGQIDRRATVWISLAGAATAALGAALTSVVDGRLLLIVTAILLAWQALRVAGANVGRGRVRGEGRGGREGTAPEARERREASPAAYAGIGALAGLASGLLGIGGGIVIVPLLAGWLGVPLKRALGTSLASIVAIVIPGTIVHAVLGNIDWAVAAVLVIGSVGGARVGARIALGARERTLRLLVATFLGAVALAYGINQAVDLLGSGR
jgi:uncharacterized membrane protein YfcA